MEREQRFRPQIITRYSLELMKKRAEESNEIYGHLNDFAASALGEMSYDQAHLYDYVINPNATPQVTEPEAAQLAAAFAYEAIPERIREEVEIDQEDINITKMMVNNLYQIKSDNVSFADLGGISTDLSNSAPEFARWLGDIIITMDDAQRKFDFLVGATQVTLPFYRKTIGK